MERSHIKYDILLIIIAIVWGTGFIGTKYTLEAGLPAGFTVATRNIIGALFIALIFIKQMKKTTKADLKHGFIAGLFLASGFIVQTLGMQYTEVSNNAFLTTTNVIFVPFVSWFLVKKRPKAKVFLSVALGFVGIFILTRAFEANITFNLGDTLSLICAILFACQIAYIGFVAEKTNSIPFSAIQMGTTAVLATIYFFIVEQPTMVIGENFNNAFLVCVYLGVVCTGFCFSGQCFAQQYVYPARCALIMTLEGVFATVFSVLLGWEPMQATMIIGGGIIMLSVILLEIDFKKRKALI